MANPPRDNFQQYYAEKLWEMIPPVYRHEDGLASVSGQLRAVVEIVAEQAAVLRRSHDRLWEDQHIDRCDDWAVPYLADLVATRLVSAQDSRARRVDVAKTIYYRRRKGTPQILEELIADMTGWDGVVVEQFRRLARTFHLLDPHSRPRAGRFSGAMPGGWVEVRNPRASERTDGPFGEFHHTIDVRRHRGSDGHYNIPKLAFHLYRLQAYRVSGFPATDAGTGLAYTVDPAGRDTPLFAPRNRPDEYEHWRSAVPWEVRAPIACRLLNHAEYFIDTTLVAALEDPFFGLTQSAIAALRSLRGRHFASESDLLLTLRSLPTAIANALTGATVYQEFLTRSLISACGKQALIPNAIRVEADGVEVPRELIVSGNLENFSAAVPGKRLVIDPVRGRLLFMGPAPADVRVDYHYGFSGPFGAGTYGRSDLQTAGTIVPTPPALVASTDILDNGVTEIADSNIYFSPPDKLSVVNVTLQAADRQRPYLELTTGDWTWSCGSQPDAQLALDGLWIGGGNELAIHSNIAAGGSYKQVIIRRCTIDPGDFDDTGITVNPTGITISAEIDELIIDHSIIGPIRLLGNGAVEKIVIRDSILQSIDPAAVKVLRLPKSEAVLQRATVFGELEVLQLHASDTLITHDAEVTNVQEGCFRFSAATAASRLPRRYESHEIDDTAHFFVSQRFSRPGYAQLSESAPAFLHRGAEERNEIGVFSTLRNPDKRDSLQAKVDEFMPFGLIPIFIPVT